MSTLLINLLSVPFLLFLSVTLSIKKHTNYLIYQTKCFLLTVMCNFMKIPSHLQMPNPIFFPTLWPWSHPINYSRSQSFHPLSIAKTTITNHPNSPTRHNLPIPLPLSAHTTAAQSPSILLSINHCWLLTLIHHPLLSYWNQTYLNHQPPPLT